MPSNSKSGLSPLGCALLVYSCVAVLSLAASAAQAVRIERLDDRLRVELNGELFTEYHFRDVPRPYLYPLIGPDNSPMTRNWPMKEVADEERDHLHHRSLWFTHGAVNGHDFWSEAKGHGRIVHDQFAAISSSRDAGIIQAKNNWVAADGTLICRDETTIRVHAPKNDDERLLDYEVTVHALDRDLVFGDTKEGSMAVRLAETMRLKGKVGKGHIINSAGDRDDATWGKRAEWCDYYGPVNGRTVGIAIFDHPKNPRHPTWWHVRDYGLFAANPFGKHDFERLADRKAGDLTVSAKGSITFKYRFYFHRGDHEQARIAERYREYAR